MTLLIVGLLRGLLPPSWAQKGFGSARTPSLCLPPLKHLEPVPISIPPILSRSLLTKLQIGSTDGRITIRGEGDNWLTVPLMRVRVWALVLVVHPTPSIASDGTPINPFPLPLEPTPPTMPRKTGTIKLSNDSNLV